MICIKLTKISLYTCAKQTHGSNITVVTGKNRGKGRRDYSDSIEDTDALIVLEKNIMINIHLADCVPIVIYDYKKMTAYYSSHCSTRFIIIY
jgi:copper oxidase (laccase) domain-containing protein